MPITRFHLFDESRTRLPFRFSVANYLPGEPVAAFQGEPDVADLYHQMGGLLRKLHTVCIKGFGRLDANGLVDPAPTNEAFITGLWSNLLERFRHYGADPALADRLNCLVVDRLPLVRHSDGAVFAHDDMQPHNVLAERDGAGRLRLTGLIDFGNARAADPLFDLAKTLFCCEHDAPALRPPSARATARSIILNRKLPSGCTCSSIASRCGTGQVAEVNMVLRHVGVVPEGGPKHDLILDLEAMAAGE